ncbi:hypothetical protein ABPG77_011335 [Micractinium sp. CCAP 211/92]
MGKTAGGSRSLSAIASWAFFFGALLLLICQRLGYMEASAAVNRQSTASPAACTPGRSAHSGSAVGSSIGAQPATFGGVHHYAIPGAFQPLQPEVDPHPVAGTLHVFLKAARWPDGHLRAKGFAVFEIAQMPAFWAKRKPPVQGAPLRNVPEAAHRLRMAVRSPSRGWKREIALPTSFDHCEAKSASPDFDYEGCVQEARNATQDSYSFPDISLDFGLAEGAPTDMELYVIGWPRRISLEVQVQQALVAEDPLPEDEPDSDAPPALYITLPYLKNVDPAKMARLLTWNLQYHLPLGFRGIVMYVLPRDADLLAAQPGIQKLLASVQLTLVVWDLMAPIDTWHNYDQRVVQAHSVLSFWGRNVRVLVNEHNEFLIPGKPKKTLPDLLGDGCLADLRPECLYFSRQSIFAHNGFGSGVKQPEPALWDATSGGNPLRNYRFAVQHDFPKAFVDPNHVLPVSLHWTSACVGNSSIANGRTGKKKLRSQCGYFTHCEWVPQECGYVGHVANMFSDRETPLNAPAMKPEGWLWMLEKDAKEGSQQ